MEHELNRRERLKAIKDIIESKMVSSQEDLVEELKVRGYKVAQSTISRDLHELRLVKVRNHKQQEYYSLDGRFASDSIFTLEKFKSKFSDSVLSVSTAENILVIRTYPGEAQGTAAVVDGMNFVEILGTVAGDDTIICIAGSRQDAEKMKELMDSQ